MLTPVTPPCYLTINQSELCTNWSVDLQCPALTWPLKMLCWNPSGSLEFFGGVSHRLSLHGPAVSLSLLQTPMFWFVWPHCALGTRIRVWEQRSSKTKTLWETVTAKRTKEACQLNATWYPDGIWNRKRTVGGGSKKILLWASLVAQWLRVRLPMQGTWVRALVWEDPTCHGATRPVSHNYWACASGACAPQQERPR